MQSFDTNGDTQGFLRFADRCLKSQFEFWPQNASYFGLHEYDGKTPDISRESVERRLNEIGAQLQELQAMDASSFDANTRLDYWALKQGLEAERFRWGEQREQSYNPVLLVWLTDVTNYIKRDYAPIEERVRKMIEYERGIPKLVEQFTALLEPPLAKVLIEMAVQLVNGQIVYMRDKLEDVISEDLTDEKLLSEFREANTTAIQALQGYVDFLNGQLERAKEDFAIGAHMFERMLAVNELVDLPIEQVLAAGHANLEENKAALIEIARQIDPNKSVKEVVRMVSDDHPTAESLIPDTAAMLEEIRRFIIDENIVTVPSEVRCKVKETPEFMRFGFAFMDSPGPFEKKATEAYYYVTPVEPDWSEQQQEEWLRRFNYNNLCDVSIHESYPGHYVHFLHAAHVMSPVLKVFGSYAFIEGWAHYCEQMMVEEGYKGENPRLHFAQLGEALMRNSRYIVSIMMHTGRMSLDEATRFFMENAYMEELPAHKEALRGTFDPGYLNYTLGKLMLLKLREDVKAKEGDNFSLKNFHDRVLALGYPPVPLVRRHLLGEDSGAIL